MPPLNATILDRTDLHDSLSILKVRPDAGPCPPFIPGQFCDIALPKDPSEINPNSPAARRGRIPMTRRSYSIASSADQRDHLELLIVLVPEGRLTPKLWRLRAGDKLWMADECGGRFTLEPVRPDKDLVFVATDTGLAPYVSMLRTYRSRAAQGGPGPPWRRCVIIHGVRYAHDLAYRDELEDLAAADPAVTYLPTVTREPPESSWQGLRGRVQTLLEPQTYHAHTGLMLDPQQCHIFLCGNPDMIAAVSEQLAPCGFATEESPGPGDTVNIHFERYW